MKQFEIKKDVFWVGVQDFNLKVFDIVVETKWGTTYNSYIIKGNKTVLVDTVKEAFYDEFLDKLRAVVNPEQIDYIIVNHTEPDHSGALGKLLDVAVNAEVIGSQAAIIFAKAITNKEFKHRIVQEGDTLDLGNKHICFMSAPLMHWPDTIFSYLEEEKILFSCDAFGCHFCAEKMFNDEVGDFSEALSYYYDAIMSPFKAKIRENLPKLKGIDIDIIAPSHGPILRENPRQTIDKYVEWSRDDTPQDDKKHVLIGYVSAYDNTKRMAAAIADGLLAKGTLVDVMDISQTDLNLLRQKVEEAHGIIIGSPTINQDVVYPVWSLLASISPITNRSKPCAAFGSYGWSGEAVKMIEERFRSLKMKVIESGLRFNFVPTAENLATCKAFGEKFAEML